jgi:hypothetical protein
MILTNARTTWFRSNELSFTPDEEVAPPVKPEKEKAAALARTRIEFGTINLCLFSRGAPGGKSYHPPSDRSKY